ncbi:L-threonylcarbamoyladenylate synthase [Lysobacter sp. H23M47]|uniref:L-threonylcarbamoyladenylate synthase n=1 Tax=Lysobacter sp. H23M47 TaxID=2781024 RepID=UPI001882132B|nr:L-threonylcarbamoyladenylate synthase [Lysobacter sp. H23M47]QOW24734.1 threonylcarbamoyl-AMP synthase [Lysobacter sp. H23M47]
MGEDVSAPFAGTLCDLQSVVRALRQGGVIAYPTEAVWGLGCDPFNQAAVVRLLDIKQRPVAKGLILIAGALAQLDGLVDWSALAAERCVEVRASWPGPHTWVVPATASVPRVITGDHDSVAVRVSAHPTVVALCAAWGGVLVSTSANLAGRPPATCIDQLDPALLARIDGVLTGDVGGRASPSTIRDARTGAILRA